MLRLRTLGPGTFLTASGAVSIASARDTDVTTPKPILMAVASPLAGSELARKAAPGQPEALRSTGLPLALS